MKKNTKKQNAREINIEESIRVVTTNNFLEIIGEPEMSIVELKLLLIAISQVRKDDSEFYKYNLSVQKYSELTGVDASHLYRQFKDTGKESLCSRMMGGIPIFLTGEDGKQIRTGFFLACTPDSVGGIEFYMNPMLEPFLLNISQEFMKPLLKDFTRMKSVYAIKLWMYYQSLMGSEKPKPGEVWKRQVYIDDLRRATGTTDKHKENRTFKTNVLNPGHNDIRRTLKINIEIGEPIKKNGKAVGYWLSFTNIDELEYQETKVKEKKKYFDDINLNSAFHDYLKWWEEQFGRKPHEKTVRTWVNRLEECSGGDIAAAMGIIEKTISLAFRQLIDPRKEKERKNKNTGKGKTNVKKGVKDTQFANFPQREYTKDDFSRIEGIMAGKRKDTLVEDGEMYPFRKLMKQTEKEA